MNNINVTNSTIGVLNTGTIASVDASVTLLKQAGSNDAGEAIAKLTEALVHAVDLSTAQKDNALQILAALAAEAAKPAQNRQKAVGRALLDGLKHIAAATTSIAAIWAHALPLLQHYFPV